MRVSWESVFKWGVVITVHALLAIHISGIAEAMSMEDVEVIVMDRANVYNLNADHMVRIAKCEA